MDDTTVVANDLRRLIDDTEALLQHTVQGAGQEYTRARHRVEQSLLAAKARAGELQEAALARGREAVGSSDRYVRSHPWESIGVAAAVGLALGVIIGRR
jgi:ElaB/YqjD/DUF883 family membrane-anchored ribosome-binding protein